jgi:spermidine/putrescine transport system ATP-binding protein
VDEVLHFDAVNKQYGRVLAVDGMSFAIERGSFVALLGPSGCGKTTTLRLAGGFEHPTSGHIHIDGRPMSQVPAHMRPVNTVFQEFSLFPHLTVFDNVAFGPRLRRVPKADVRRRVEEMLELVRLPGLGARRPHELSGGQQQRVALARALVNRPTILLLDEPLSNLDYKLRKEMRIELKRIQREVRITFVFVTHDQEEALTLSDFVIVMSGGRIQQMGDPVTLYARPANLFVADFIGTVNVLDGEVAPGGPEQATVQILGLPERVTTPYTDVSAGTRVAVCIRREKLRLSRQPPVSAANVLPGRVEESLYLGDRAEVLVRLRNGRALQCLHVFDEDPRGAMAVGDEVFVAWEPEGSLVFRNQ